MASDVHCPRCGERLPPDQPDCPYCSRRTSGASPHHDLWLFVLVVLAIAGLWAVAHYITDAYAARQRALAREWYDRGESEMRAARLVPAIADLRTALAYSHEDPAVRLKLAEALAAANRLQQAGAYLRALWEQQPGNANVNLELARLAARQHDYVHALRYYHGAIYGVWEDNAIVRRRDARLELIEFLLGEGARQQAQSELIAVATELPPDPALLNQAGGYFLQAGDPHRAFDEFELAAQLDPRNPTAAAGAGRAAFEKQDYPQARRYLQAAVSLNSADHQSADLLRTAESVLQMDPSAPRLTHEQQVRRVNSAVQQAQSRVESCAVQKGFVLTLQLDVHPSGGPLNTDYAELMSLKPRLRSSILRAEPDLVGTVMEAVYRSEVDAARLCGAPAGPDLALLLIGRRHEGGTP